jgi:hypothetical protein
LQQRACARLARRETRESKTPMWCTRCLDTRNGFGVPFAKNANGPGMTMLIDSSARDDGEQK